MTQSEQSVNDLFPDYAQVRVERALRDLSEAGVEALAFYRAGEFDAAQAEVDRARRSVRVLDEVRREQGKRS